jgi:hypothetical protein
LSVRFREVALTSIVWGENQVVDLEEIIDGLYALPAAEFTAARNAVARELRQAGLRAEAARVAEQRKPTAAPAAVNHLVRIERLLVERFLEAAAALRDAQLAGSKNLETVTKKERELLVELIRVGGPEVRQSLQAAAVDQAAADQLLEGRLTHELEPPGFGSLFEHAKNATAKPVPSATRTTAKNRAKPDDRAARARLAEAKKTLATAHSSAQQAERQWDRARDELARAQAAVDKAQAALEELRRP